LRVLLTGASGFIGSRVLARLVARGISTVVLVRSTSSRSLMGEGLGCVDVREGSLGDAASLAVAMEGVTHVIHCAGKTKVLRESEFEEVNVGGTRKLLGAAIGAGVSRIVHLSSLAAVGPARSDRPAMEGDEVRPVSAYGRSKLGAERVLLGEGGVQSLVLRPGGVYGPGDRDFLELFRAVKRGLCPMFDGGRQELTLVYVEDLVDVVVGCLDAEVEGNRIYHVANSEVVTAGELASGVAAVMGCRPWKVWLPSGLLVPLSWGAELVSRVTGRPGILGVDRRKELMASGWVCDVSRLVRETGLECRTGLREGLERTVAWYREAGWVGGAER
jgi:nucleoside-diphosphate-sugar epimerase